MISRLTSLGPMTFWVTGHPPYVVRREYTAKDNGLTWTYTEL